MRFRSWCLAAMMAVCLSLPACALGSSRKQAGIAAGAVQQRFGVVNAAGWGPQDTAKAARLGVSVDRIELNPGDRPSYDDWLISDDVRAGLRPLILINQYSSLASLNQTGFVAWAAQTAARYSRGGAFWREHPELNSALAPDYFELLNEPYNTAWFGAVPDPVDYAHLFASTVTAARAAHARAGWLLAAGPHYTDAAGVIHDWDRELTAAVPGIVGLAAGVTVHAYGARSWTGDPDWGWSHLPVVHQDFPTLPVWITEVGYSSTADPGGMAAGEQQKAQAVRWYVRQVAATPWIRALFIYGFIDAGPDPTNPEDNYGLISYDGSQLLPAYGAYQQALASLRPKPRCQRRSSTGTRAPGSRACPGWPAVRS